MPIKNTQTRYGIVSILLHWVMAILIIGLIIVGLYMVQIPISLRKLKLYGWHKEYGILALMLATLRILWRWDNIIPELNIPTWEKIAARTAHWTFYLFMFAMPITGWLITSSAGLPVSFFGLFVLPNLVTADENHRVLFEEIHKWLGYGLIGLILLHTSAALKHHFIDKDDILRRMIS